MCVCVCVFFPFILNIKFVGRTSRGHTGGRSHRISPIHMLYLWFAYNITHDTSIRASMYRFQERNLTTIPTSKNQLLETLVITINPLSINSRIPCQKFRTYLTKSTYCFLVLFFFFSFISLIADGPHHYHSACDHKGSPHLSPVHALQFFYRDASSALTTRQQMVEYKQYYPMLYRSWSRSVDQFVRRVVRCSNSSLVTNQFKTYGTFAVH